MNSNGCSCGHKDRPPCRRPDGLAALAADVDNLAAENRTGLTAAARAERILILRRLLDRLEGHWLGELAAAAASSCMRTARALFRGPSPRRPRP